MTASKLFIRAEPYLFQPGPDAVSRGQPGIVTKSLAVRFLAVSPRLPVTTRSQYSFEDKGACSGNS